ncbi:hypothetical protein T492DRAFT_848631 [Pavlovales sp. CCMP2436]|nr:hypothetical protein T492DRAFT_848631 [Pavlovales sp. CCMP2436]
MHAFARQMTMEDHICPLTLEPLRQPKTTDCGHTFEAYRLEDYRIAGSAASPGEHPPMDMLCPGGCGHSLQFADKLRQEFDCMHDQLASALSAREPLVHAHAELCQEFECMRDNLANALSAQEPLRQELASTQARHTAQLASEREQTQAELAGVLELVRLRLEEVRKVEV